MDENKSLTKIIKSGTNSKSEDDHSRESHEENNRKIISQNSSVHIKINTNSPKKKNKFKRALSHMSHSYSSTNTSRSNSLSFTSSHTSNNSHEEEWSPQINEIIPKTKSLPNMRPYFIPQSFEYIIGKQYVKILFDEANENIYSTISFKILGQNVLFCKGVQNDVSYDFSYDLAKKDYEGILFVYLSDGSYKIHDESIFLSGNELTFLVFSREWYNGTNKKSYFQNVQKTYPVYIISRQTQYNIKTFVNTHYSLLDKFF